MTSSVSIMDRVGDDAEAPKKTLKDRVQEAVEGFLEGLSEVLEPGPTLVPVKRPIRGPRPARRDHRWS